MMMIRAIGKLLLVMVLLSVCAVSAHANLMATATISTNQTSAPFSYRITLHNSGTTNIGTFWFAWMPGMDFLPTTPTSIIEPAGWSATVNGSGTSDGRSIEFIDNSSLLTPGTSLSGFGFTSNDTPAQLAGKSPFFTSAVVGTSFVYAGVPFSDAGFQLNASIVPEPSAIVLAGIFVLIVLLQCLRSNRKYWPKCISHFMSIG
jgi:hypothetical protein